ncbi:MAG TPA: hypothetical protein VMN57_16565 [Anaerolineales bacterium]|nr:hypothetical protein [Anaerolineales bacterium]
MPIWEAPDEPAHYHYILHILENRSLPEYEDTPEAGQPPLYYLMASLPLGILQQIDREAVELYQPPSLRDEALATGSLRLWDWNRDTYRFLAGPLLLRWLNIAVGLAAVVFIYRGALIFTFGNTSLALAAAALIGLTPQFLHIAASVSNDPLAYLTGAVLFWLLGLIVTRAFSPGRLIVIGLLAITVPFLVKFTAVPAGIAVAIAALVKLRSHLTTRPRVLAVLAGGFGLAAIGAWVLLGTSLGDRLYFELAYRLGTFRSDPFAGPVLYQLGIFAWSFWGLIGLVRVGLPSELIIVLSGLSLIGLLLAFQQSFLARDRRLVIAFGAVLLTAGLVIAVGLGYSLVGSVLVAAGVLVLRRDETGPAGDQARIWPFLWLFVLIGVAAFVRNFLTTPQFQGRFVFPSAGAITTLIVIGWDAMLGRRSDVILVLVTAGMMLMNLWMWFAQVIPVFYQPFLD